MARRRDPAPDHDEGERPFAFVADPERPGACVLRVGRTDQSYVDPGDPLHLEFDYMQRFADAIEGWRPAPERLRILHVGGGALTLPRYVAATRPTSAQVVLEPDEDLTRAVRDELPLPPRSGIKVRAVDGRAGVAALADDWCDVVVVDAFAGGRVPAELVSVEFLADVARVLVPGGLFVANIADQTPFAWSRRVVAGLLQVFPDAAAGALAGTWRGRRYGNIVLLGSDVLDLGHVVRRSAGAPFPYRWQPRHELARWAAGAVAFTDADSEPSSPPSDSVGAWLAG